MKRLFFAKYGYMTLSVLFFLAGLAYMFLPDLPEMAVCLMLGILLIVYGAVKLVGYLAPDRYSLAFQYDMASAIILLILGLLVLIFNVRAYTKILESDIDELLSFKSNTTVSLLLFACFVNIKYFGAWLNPFHSFSWFWLFFNWLRGHLWSRSRIINHLWFFKDRLCLY